MELLPGFGTETPVNAVILSINAPKAAKLAVSCLSVSRRCFVLYEQAYWRVAALEEAFLHLEMAFKQAVLALAAALASAFPACIIILS